jgi:hypothetical protein
VTKRESSLHAERAEKFSSKVVEKKNVVSSRKLIASVVHRILLQPVGYSCAREWFVVQEFYAKSGFLKTLYFAKNLSNSRVDLQANRSSFLSILVLLGWTRGTLL